jgi:hypothetical protein
MLLLHKLVSPDADPYAIVNTFILLGKLEGPLLCIIFHYCLGQCSPYFFAADPLRLQKSTTDPHILAHVNILSRWSTPPRMAQQPRVGQGLLTVETSRSHSDTPQSVELLWTSDQPDADLTIHITHKRQTSMLPAGFEPTIPASERSQNHALDRVATGMSGWQVSKIKNLYLRIDFR